MSKIDVKLAEKVFVEMKESVASTYRGGYASEFDAGVEKWFSWFQPAFEENLDPSCKTCPSNMD